MRILVVDDNRNACDSLAWLLRAVGHETETAYDGIAAVALAETYLPDIILLDLGMPRLSGYETCQHIRETAWGGRVKVIALTGWGQPQDRHRTKEAGFDAHIVKPLDLAELHELLTSMGTTSMGTPLATSPRGH